MHASPTPAGSGRLLIALAILALLGILSLVTMDPGRYRTLAFLLLGFFALRIVLTYMRSR